MHLNDRFVPVHRVVQTGDWLVLSDAQAVHITEVEPWQCAEYPQAMIGEVVGPGCIPDEIIHRWHRVMEGRG